VLYGVAREPHGITNIPGFRSKVECTIAAGEILKDPVFNDPSSIHILAWCTPGPDR
jgi:hypothetical protein